MREFPVILTKRLRLDRLDLNDIPQIVKYANNPNISTFTQNIPFPYGERDAAYWVNLARQGFGNGTTYIFAIREIDNPDFIGGISLSVEHKHHRAELGYWLAEPFWNRGYMTEAARAVTAFAFDTLGLNKITCSHFKENIASGKVMVRCGMKMEAEFKEHLLKNVVFHTLIVYGLTRKDYEQFHVVNSSFES